MIYRAQYCKIMNHALSRCGYVVLCHVGVNPGTWLAFWAFGLGHQNDAGTLGTKTVLRLVPFRNFVGSYCSNGGVFFQFLVVETVTKIGSPLLWTKKTYNDKPPNWIFENSFCSDFSKAGGPVFFFSRVLCLNYIIHPGRLTWNLQITHLERKMIFQTSMIMFHVNLQGCIIYMSFKCSL